MNSLEELIKGIPKLAQRYLIMKLCGLDTVTILKQLGVNSNYVSNLRARSKEYRRVEKQVLDPNKYWLEDAIELRQMMEIHDSREFLNSVLADAKKRGSKNLNATEKRLVIQAIQALRQLDKGQRGSATLDYDASVLSNYQRNNNKGKID